MKILLDTQAFLWSCMDAPEFSRKARKIFLDEKNELYISLASVWEIAIKISIGKLKLKKAFEKIILQQSQENGITLLNMSFRHIVKTASLPLHHRDPFDRLIAAQALEEKMQLVSCDIIFDEYGVKRTW